MFNHKLPGNLPELWLINNSKKYLFSNKRSLKFIQLSCLALILVMIFTIPDHHPINSAQKRDRFFQDGRIRNAFVGGRFDTQSNHFLLPGKYDEVSGSWQETEFNVSTHTGNVAWAMLALLGYYESYGGEEYLKSAIAMGEWIEQNCRDQQGIGYTAGYTGWEGKQQKLSYKSSEHNLDLYAAFTRLYLLTGEPVWHERGDRAREFVLTMRDRYI